MQPLRERRCGEDGDTKSRYDDFCVERFHLWYSISTSPALNNYDVFCHAQELEEQPFFKLNFILSAARQNGIKLQTPRVVTLGRK
jgi:hypothetical protein